MNLDTLYRSGVQNAWSSDYEAQKYYTDIITELRGMKENPFKEINGIFIPNDSYMKHYFGEEIVNESYGCYDYDGRCNWNNCLLLPILNVADKIAGFVSFNPFKYLEAKETNDWSIYYYAYSSKNVFSKGNYLFTLDGVYKRAIEDGYLLLVDGVFDTINVTRAGFNAAGLLGSTLTPQIIMLLRFIKKIVLLMDNDDAGIQLYNNLKTVLPSVDVVKQSWGKDADDALKSDYREEYIGLIKDAISDIQLPKISSFSRWNRGFNHA